MRSEAMIDRFLEGNRKFLEEDFAQNPEHYGSLVSSQSPTVLWIGCSDSRVNPERITGAKAGEIFVQRNIGNIVPIHDWNFATVLEYAVNHLKVDDIVVCGHSDCGAMKALDKESTDAYIPLWLNNAVEAKTRVDARISSPKTPEEEKERRRMIELENIKLQLEHLRTYPPVKAAEKAGKIRLHGVYFDLATGKLAKIC
jgi:carbonic anhydrase